MHYSACIKYPLCDLTLLVGHWKWIRPGTWLTWVVLENGH